MFYILPVWQVRTRMASLCVYMGLVTLFHAYGKLSVFLNSKYQSRIVVIAIIFAKSRKYDNIGESRTIFLLCIQTLSKLVHVPYMTYFSINVL